MQIGSVGSSPPPSNVPKALKALSEIFKITYGGRKGWSDDINFIYAPTLEKLFVRIKSPKYVLRNLCDSRQLERVLISLSGSDLRFYHDAREGIDCSRYPYFFRKGKNHCY